MTTLAAAALAAITSTACLDLDLTGLRTDFQNPASGTRVLFIGNSLTYYNDLPKMVQSIADAAGGDSLIIDMVAGPDLALVDHWNAGNAHRAVASSSWDFVVLQQGPSSTSINRDSLRTLTQMFAPVIRNAGRVPVLFSAWPSSGRREDFPRAAESYRLAAPDVNGLYAPVANGWLEAWNRQPTLPLYSDGLHGNVTGSYLAALVINSRIFGKTPVGLPATIPLRNGGTIDVPEALTTMLQEAAWAAVQPTLPPELVGKRGARR